jgi:HlyD family secretion protein
MTKNTQRRLAWGAAGLAVAGGLFFFLNRPRPAALVQPVTRDVVEVVVASGKLRAVRQSQVGAEIAGVVDTLSVSEGDTVKQGQVLGRLRLGETDARLAGAQAALRAAETTLQGEESQLVNARQETRRLRELADRKLVPAKELTDAEAAERFQVSKTESARARLQEARAELQQVLPEFGKREVRAPFDGVVIQRLVEPGQAVTSSTGWFAVAEMSLTEIYVETDENNLGKLRVGQPAIAVAPAFPDQPFAARLTQVGPNVDSDRGVVGLRLVAEELPPFILPNMTVDVNIEVKRTNGGTALPASAVATQGPPSVMAVVDGRTVRQPVKVVGRNPEWVAVEGLPPEATVLREIAGAREGQRVRPAPEGAGRPGGPPGGPPGRG